MGRLLLLILILIAYGSIYPGRFEARPGVDPVVVLLHSWPAKYYGYVLRDALLNFVLYLPLGGCAYLLFRRWLKIPLAVTFATLLGFLLAVCVEIAQVYEATRATSLLDVTMNTLGSAAGVGLAIVFLDYAGRKASDARAFFVFALWLVSLMFPLVPVHSSVLLADKLLAFSRFPPVAFVSALVAWYTAGCLLTDVKVRNVTGWLFVSVFLVPLQVLVSARQPTIGMLAGALAGAALFAFTHHKDYSRFLALALVLALVLRGAEPFSLLSQPHSFTWIPFADFIESNWQRTGFVLAEKFFYCTAAVWAIQRTGIRLGMAVMTLAAVLAMIEGIQMWLPGRSAGITDPMLALISGLVLDVLSQPLHTNFQPLRNLGLR